MLIINFETIHIFTISKLNELHIHFDDKYKVQRK